MAEFQLITLIIFGVVGFVIGYLTGFNPYNIYMNLGTVIFLIPVVYFVILSALNPSLASENTEKIINWYANNILGIVIADIAGAVVGAVVREFK